MAKEAIYDNEVTINVTDPPADQNQDLATVGDKVYYKGAHYKQGQPFIVEGDAKMDFELNKAVDESELGDKESTYFGDRHYQKKQLLEQNYGAHFDY